MADRAYSESVGNDGNADVCVSALGALPLTSSATHSDETESHAPT